jgi:hypothetical protein
MFTLDKTALASCLHWVTEREKVRVKKERGLPYPWTDDKVISSYRFCNVRREDDRVTVWIRKNIREVYGNGFRKGNQYLWFMLCIARQINWPDTLAYLIEEGCWPGESTFSPEAMGRCLQDLAEADKKVFTGAYNITAPPTKGMKKTTWVAEHTLGNLWNERSGISSLFSQKPSLKFVHSQLVKFDCWGPFMAYQAVVDMRFCPSLLMGAKDVDYWAAAGPGTIRGLNRIFGRKLEYSLNQEQACSEMKYLAPIIKKETEVNFDFSDVPNIMCETDKYIRVTKGEGKTRAVYVPGRGS